MAKKSQEINLANLGQTHEMIDGFIAFLKGTLPEAYRGYIEGIYDQGILSEIFIYSRDQLPEDLIKSVWQSKDRAEALKEKRIQYMINNAQAASADYEMDKALIDKLVLENNRLKASAQQLEHQLEAGSPIKDRGDLTPETKHKVSWWQRRKNQKRGRRLEKEVDAILMGSIMEKSAFDYDQKSFLLECALKHVPLTILKKIANASYTVPIMQRILQVYLQYQNDATTTTLIDGLLCKGDYNEEQLFFIIDCIKDGMDSCILNQIAKPIYPVAMMKNLSIHLKKKYGEDRDGR